jgi:hypothetical protein
MLTRDEWRFVLALTLTSGCGGSPPQAAEPTAPEVATEPGTPAAAPAVKPTPAASDADAQKLSATEVEPSGLGLANRIVMRDPNGPDPQGPPQLEVELARSTISVNGATLSQLDVEPEILHNTLQDYFQSRRSEVTANGEHPYYALRVTDDVGLGPLKLTLRALAFAGWPDARLQLGNRSVEVRVASIGAPVNAENIPPQLAWNAESLMVVVQEKHTALLRVHQSPKPTGENNPAPAPTVLAELPAGATASKVRSAISSACKAVRCTPIALSATNSGSFARLTPVLEALGAQQPSTQPLYVEVRTYEPSNNPDELLLPERVGLIPRRRLGATTVSGHLPKGVIQSTIREHLGEFRSCYEAGLSRNPKLTGKVVMRFVIDRQGKVPTARALADEMPDAKVAQCLHDAFSRLRFPAPEGGVITVVYPLVFEPPHSSAATE